MGQACTMPVQGMVLMGGASAGPRDEDAPPCCDPPEVSTALPLPRLRPLPPSELLRRAPWALPPGLGLGGGGARVAWSAVSWVMSGVRRLSSSSRKARQRRKEGNGVCMVRMGMAYRRRG